MLIGLSLSSCIKDLLNNTKRIEDVTCIITGTAAPHPQDFEFVINEYCRTYWRDDPVKARDIASKLYHTGRIIQPRIFGQSPPTIHNGYWI